MLRHRIWVCLFVVIILSSAVHSALCCSSDCPLCALSRVLGEVCFLTAAGKRLSEDSGRHRGLSVICRKPAATPVQLRTLLLD